MRRLVGLLIVLLLLVGCSTESKRPAPFPAPLDWYLKGGMAPEPIGDCPFGTPHDVTLAGLRVFGFGGLIRWHPGHFGHVQTWGEGYADLVILSLRPIGEERPVYRLSIEGGAAFVQTPPPGCWELTVEANGHSESLILPVRPERPAFLAAEQLSNGPISLPETNKRLSELLELIATGKEAPAPGDQERSVLLTLHWTNEHDAEIHYFPGAGGRSAILGVPESLVTGDCLKTGRLFRRLPTNLSERIEQDLARIEHRTAMYTSTFRSSGCTAFTLSRP